MIALRLIFLLCFFLAFRLSAEEKLPRTLEAFRKTDVMTTMSQVEAAFGKPDRERKEGEPYSFPCFVYDLKDGSEVQVILDFGGRLLEVSRKDPQSGKVERFQDWLIDPKIAAQESARFKDVMPAEWKFTEAKDAVVPYGFTPEKTLGRQLVFTGPRQVEVTGIGRQKRLQPEEFHLWIMPFTYTPGPFNGSQFGWATPLGINESVLIYEKQFFASETPSWPNWKEDVIRIFGLTGKVPASLSQPSMKGFP